MATRILPRPKQSSTFDGASYGNCNKKTSVRRSHLKRHQIELVVEEGFERNMWMFTPQGYASCLTNRLPGDTRLGDLRREHLVPVFLRIDKAIGLPLAFQWREIPLLSSYLHGIRSHSPTAPLLELCVP